MQYLIRNNILFIGQTNGYFSVATQGLAHRITNMPHPPTTGPRNRNRIKIWFLTYPQCGDLSPTDVRDHMMTLDTVKEFLITTELHEDGGRHLHCFFKFQTGITHRRAMTEFDILGRH